jgi:hypothetical protein
MISEGDARSGAKSECKGGESKPELEGEGVTD